MTEGKIATPPLREARNDRGEDCHGLPTGALAMTEGEIATPPLREARIYGYRFLIRDLPPPLI
jgi:hypothetical protein